MRRRKKQNAADRSPPPEHATFNGVKVFSATMVAFRDVLGEKVTEWIEPALIAEIGYSQLTPDKMFREPVFIRLRPDLR